MDASRKIFVVIYSGLQPWQYFEAFCIDQASEKNVIALCEKLIKIGAKVIGHSRYVIFQVA
jgi:hypothetical protein